MVKKAWVTGCVTSGLRRPGLTCVDLRSAHSADKQCITVPWVFAALGRVLFDAWVVAVHTNVQAQARVLEVAVAASFQPMSFSASAHE